MAKILETEAIAFGIHGCALCMDVDKTLIALDNACAVALKELDAADNNDVHSVARHAAYYILKALSATSASLVCVWRTRHVQTVQTAPPHAARDADPVTIGLTKFASDTMFGRGRLVTALLSCYVQDMQRRVKHQRTNVFLKKTTQHIESSMRADVMTFVATICNESELLQHAMFRLMRAI